MAFKPQSLFNTTSSTRQGSVEAMGAPVGTVNQSAIDAKLNASRWIQQNSETPKQPPPFTQLRMENPNFYVGWRNQAAGSRMFQEDFLPAAMAGAPPGVQGQPGSAPPDAGGLGAGVKPPPTQGGTA